MLLTEKLFYIIWSSIIGGVIGSFLNVVVYRVPRGMSLIGPLSHCPKCKEPIRWYHNIPVFGWIMLRGKCRDCRRPISPRYPIVELTTAFIFGTLTAMEYAFHDVIQILPERIERLVGIPDFESANAISFVILLYHLFLMCILLVGALIDFDQSRQPARMYIWTILIGMIFPLQWAFLRPVPAWASEPSFLSGGIDGIFGFAAGCILGFIAWKIQKTERPGGLPYALACVGVFLGWQTVVPLGVVSAILGVVVTMIIRQKRHERLIPTSAFLGFLTFFWILYWEPLANMLSFTGMFR